MIEITGEANLHGHQIDLDWTWVGPGGRPPQRLIRRQQAYAAGPDEALCVVDLDDLFEQADRPWARVERARYLVPNSAAEGGLLQAEIALYTPFDMGVNPPAPAAAPSAAAVTIYNQAAGVIHSTSVPALTRLADTTAAAPPWTTVHTIEFFAEPGGGPEVSQGQVIISSGNADGVTPDRFEWIAPASPPVSADYGQRVIWDTQTTFTSEAEAFRAAIVTTQDGNALWALELDENFDLDTGDWHRHTILRDGGLTAGVVYYYSLYTRDPALPGVWLLRQVSVMALGRYGLDDQLYRLLPAVHRRYDEPEPADRNQGALRRYLQVVGSALDQVRGLAEGLRSRHDTLTVQAELLPRLAHGIGWDLDQTLGVPEQRTDVLFASQIYETVGTLPNVRALVNRMTGWDCQTKEFVHNVFLTNAPEDSHLWEIWEQRGDGATWTDPAPLTQTDQFDGRPSAVRDSTGQVWLFWHSDRAGRREIWLQRPGLDAQPRRAMEGAPDDTGDMQDTIDEYPAAVVDGTRVWLFWSSNRDGHWNIWARPYGAFPGGAPVPITDHPAEDRSPAALRDSTGRVWVFWQSNRRGPTDIWARIFNGATWGTPARLTTATFRDEMPAAVLDATNRIWLFWSTDTGDRRNLWAQIFDGGVWGSPQSITTGPQQDASPAAVLFGGRLWLFWQSDRTGRWRLWTQVHNGAAWTALSALTAVQGDDKEPTAVVDGAVLRLMWRSQRRGSQYKSRTVDFDDPAMLAAIHTLNDRAHYTYETGLQNEDWFSRKTVGVVLTPDTNDDAAIQSQVIRTLSFVETFRPLPVRLVWLIKSVLNDEISPVTNIDDIIENLP